MNAALGQSAPLLENNSGHGFLVLPLNSSVWVSIDHTHLKEKGQGIPQMVLGQYPEAETRAEKDLEEQMLENWHNYPIAPNSLS